MNSPKTRFKGVFRRFLGVVDQFRSVEGLKGLKMGKEKPALGGLKVRVEAVSFGGLLLL